MVKRRGKSAMVCDSGCPTWFGVLVTLAGLLFILEDLNVFRSGLSLWPVLVTLLGIWFWKGSSY